PALRGAAEDKLLQGIWDRVRLRRVSRRPALPDRRRRRRAQRAATDPRDHELDVDLSVRRTSRSASTLPEFVFVGFVCCARSAPSWLSAAGLHEGFEQRAEFPRPPEVLRDRKSTRLNSSHQIIS